jgi:hypothetical protein
MELDCYCAGVDGMKQQSCWGSVVFQEATSEPAGKAKKPAACHLMPHNKHLGKKGFNCQFRNHKIFNLASIYKTVTIQPTDLFMCSITQLFSVIFCSDTGIVFQVF